jgi:hypothetical protein
MLDSNDISIPLTQTSYQHQVYHEINFITIDGTIYQLQLESLCDLHILDLKHALCIKYQFPILSQKLYFQGVERWDDELLSSSGIEHGVMIHLLVLISPPSVPSVSASTTMNTNNNNTNHQSTRVQSMRQVMNIICLMDVILWLGIQIFMIPSFLFFVVSVTAFIGSFASNKMSVIGLSLFLFCTGVSVALKTSYMMWLQTSDVYAMTAISLACNAILFFLATVLLTQTHTIPSNNTLPPPSNL